MNTQISKKSKMYCMKNNTVIQNKSLKQLLINADKSKIKKHRLYSSSKCGQIKHGDVLEQLRKLKNDNFDGIIADPPYNIGKDFGNTKDDMDIKEYVNWCKEWITECLRVIKPSSPVFIYGFPEILCYVAVNFSVTSQKWLVWHYTNKAVPSSKFWQRSHESILCLWKDNRPKLASIDDLREPYTESFINNSAGKVRQDTISRFGKRGKKTIYNAHPNGALPRDVLKVPALAGGLGRIERWFLCRTCDQVLHPSHLHDHETHDILKHPTQKPTELTRKLILAITKKNKGKILIPFAGSGSECVIAKSMGVKFLGIELNKEYTRLASEWLRNNKIYES